MFKLKLPKKFDFFLKEEKWQLFKYQIEFLNNVESTLYQSFLISSDTGTGKTFTLFLPKLIEGLKNNNLKMIYISPLRSIISDIFDRLNYIKKSLGLEITIGKITGD